MSLDHYGQERGAALEVLLARINDLSLFGDDSLASRFFKLFLQIFCIQITNAYFMTLKSLVSAILPIHA